MSFTRLWAVLAVGLPVLTGCMDTAAFAVNGDEIEIDFTTGEARNLKTGAARRFPLLAPILCDIVKTGGAAGAMRSWLESHPEQAAGMDKAAERVAASRGAPVQFVAKAS